MTVPARPRHQPQNPALSGDPLGWLSCTAYSMAMLIDKATLGAMRPSGAEVRRHTGDTTGGLTLPQVARVATTIYMVPVELHTGASAATPAYAQAQLATGRGMVVQGNTSALLDTPHRSTSGPVNHAVYVNELDGTKGALVYDPAADGRRTGIDQGPSWWPWSLVLEFAAALRPYGDADPRVAGAGRMYVGLGPDTEPHAHLRYGGLRTAPFPDRCTAWNASPTRLVNVRARPTTAAPIVQRLRVGAPFVAYQRATGQMVAGSRTWYGDHDGARWVHASGLRGTGGAL